MFETICQGAVIFASLWGAMSREVWVPDGGTVISGARVFRSESSAPPFLLRVPYVNRLFRTVGYSNDLTPGAPFERIGIDFNTKPPTTAGFSTPWVADPGREKAFRSDNIRTPILPPIKPGERPMCDEPPDQPEILRALPVLERGVPYLCETSRDNFEFTIEKLVDVIDPPRFFPLVGPAQLHHCHWRCTVYFRETVEASFPYPFRVQKKRQETVYIDKDHLHLYAPPFDGAEASEPAKNCPAGCAGPKVITKNSATAPAQQVELSVTVVQINRTTMPAETWRWAQSQLGLPTARKCATTILKDYDSAMALFQGLRHDGFAKILAEPCVITLNGGAANVVIGGEIPDLQQVNANDSKFVGTKIEMLPTVKAGGKIVLHTAVDITTLEGTPPAIATRAAKTSTQFEIGRTLAIGGLEQTKPASTLRIPVLSDFPVIGDKFTWELQPETTYETIILVTPRLVTATPGTTIVQAAHAEPAPFPAFPAAKVERNATMSIGDVVRMSKKGISTAIIVRQMELTNAAFNLTVDDIIELHDQGVSEEIISTMQERHSSAAKATDLLCNWESRVQVVDDAFNKGAKVAGLTGRVYLISEDRNFIDAAGTIVVTLKRTEPLFGSKDPAHKWSFDAETLKKLRKKDLIGDGYTLFLPLPDVIARFEKVEMVATYHPRNGSAACSSHTTLDLRYGAVATEPPQLAPCRVHGGVKP